MVEFLDLVWSDHWTENVEIHNWKGSIISKYLWSGMWKWFIAAKIGLWKKKIYKKNIFLASAWLYKFMWFGLFCQRCWTRKTCVVTISANRTTENRKKFSARYNNKRYYDAANWLSGFQQKKIHWTYYQIFWLLISLHKSWAMNSTGGFMFYSIRFDLIKYSIKQKIINFDNRAHSMPFLWIRTENGICAIITKIFVKCLLLTWTVMIAKFY